MAVFSQLGNLENAIKIDHLKVFLANRLYKAIFVSFSIHPGKTTIHT
jgi:hypothetical protein